MTGTLRRRRARQPWLVCVRAQPKPPLWFYPCHTHLSVLVIRDTIMQYGLLVYSADGHKQQKFEVGSAASAVQDVPCAPLTGWRDTAGACAVQAYKYCLGIKSMAFSPNGQFLALGSYDEKVRGVWGFAAASGVARCSFQCLRVSHVRQARVLNHLTWSAIATYQPPRRVDGAETVSAACEPALGTAA